MAPVLGRPEPGTWPVAYWALVRGKAPLAPDRDGEVV